MSRRALLDGDVLRYEVGAVGQIDEVRHWDFVAEVLQGRIKDIVKAAGCEDFTIYLTGKTNFRDEVAVSKPYKGNRKQDKPFHFANITAYMYANYDVRLTEGLEADDLMAIEQTAHPDETVICTRDKDLRQVPGWHYGWECGKQHEYELREVREPGMLWLAKKKTTTNLIGTGSLFFYAQLLTGDTVDNIPGLPGVGAVKAYEILLNKPDEHPYPKVLAAYEKKGKDLEYLMEQAKLLWMVRELDDEGRPVMWKPPEVEDDRAEEVG